MPDDKRNYDKIIIESGEYPAEAWEGEVVFTGDVVADIEDAYSIGLRYYYEQNLAYGLTGMIIKEIDYDREAQIWYVIVGPYRFTIQGQYYEYRVVGSTHCYFVISQRDGRLLGAGFC